MKIKELFETENKQIALDEAIKLIKRDCQDFLKLNTRPIYRGYSDDSSLKVVVPGTLVKGTVRKNRQPRDTSPWFHEIMNDTLKEYSGVKARSESLFCSYQAIQAGEYGELYAIFPIGATKLIWSPHIIDPYADFQEDWGNWPSREMHGWISDIVDSADGEFDPDMRSKDRRPVLEMLFDQHGSEMYADGSSKQAQKSRHEIMVVCDSYYALPRSKFDMEALMKKVHE